MRRRFPLETPGKPADPTVLPKPEARIEPLPFWCRVQDRRPVARVPCGEHGHEGQSRAHAAAPRRVQRADPVEPDHPAAEVREAHAGRLAVERCDPVLPGEVAEPESAHSFEPGICRPRRGGGWGPKKTTPHPQLPFSARRANGDALG